MSLLLSCIIVIFLSDDVLSIQFLDEEVNFSFKIRHNPYNRSSAIPSGYHRVGDMILPESFFLKNGTIKSAVGDSRQLWPNGVIPYSIDDSLDGHHSIISSAMDQYHSYTCIKFVPAQSHHINKILLIPRDGCHSLVGYQGHGVQEVSLGRGCYNIGTIVHELGHVVGFYHEHSRPDRDAFIKINTENIDPERKSNFQIVQGTKLLSQYAVTSIMHYGSTAFSKDGMSVTMEARSGEPLYQTFDKKGLDASDILRINNLYGC